MEYTVTGGVLFLTAINFSTKGLFQKLNKQAPQLRGRDDHEVCKVLFVRVDYADYNPAGSLFPI